MSFIVADPDGINTPSYTGTHDEHTALMNMYDDWASHLKTGEYGDRVELLKIREDGGVEVLKTATAPD